jgi:glycosyltransferase involved in cell wall biosynthesis
MQRKGQKNKTCGRPFVGWCFFSRDYRTHQLFRDSWHLAALLSNVEVLTFTRGFGIKNIFLAFRKFWKNKRNKKVVFGTSEILLYSIISREFDVWVFTGLGRLLVGVNLRSKIVRWILGRLYCGQLVIVLNEQDQQEVKEIINVLPQLIHGEGYKFIENNDKFLLRINNSEIRFVYVGRIIRSKGVDKLLSEYARCSLKNWSLTIIGDNDFGNSDSVSTNEIQRYCAISKGAIVFTGFSTNVKKLLKSEDVYISMSIREGLPFSVLDAIDAGLYIVLSSVPGHLSFEGLPGVQMVNRGLEDVFLEIAERPEKVFDFDRQKRKNRCQVLFGQDTIVQQISKIVFQNDYEKI